MKVNSLSSIPAAKMFSSKKKISHVPVFPEDYESPISIAAIEEFYNLARTTVKRFERNCEEISLADREIQDLLHEIELLPSANVVEGYNFYKRLRDLRKKRRVAKSENQMLKPVYDYLVQHPDFIKEMQSIRDLCATADNRITNFEYEYRIQG